jgi:hypothetical protein
MECKFTNKIPCLYHCTLCKLWRRRRIKLGSKNSTQTEAMMSWSNEIVDIAALSLSLSLSLGWVQDFHTPTPAKFISEWCLVFCEYWTTTMDNNNSHGGSCCAVSTMGMFWLRAKLHYFINEWTKKAHHNILLCVCVCVCVCVFFLVFLRLSLYKSNDFFCWNIIFTLKENILYFYNLKRNFLEKKSSMLHWKKHI